jgi:predicted O-methyltransferase YrrM
MRSFVEAQAVQYLEGLVPPRHPKLQAMEQQAREQGFPIIGPLLGHFCYQITRMIGARRVFELGSGFGYSTAWFARGVQENGGGVVHHAVWDSAMSRSARADLDAMGYDGIVEYHIGEAIEVLRAQAGPFDLVFNDIDKRGYPDSLPVIEAKSRPGTVLIVDNMLWSGRIFDAADASPDTNGVREMTRLLTASSSWTTSVLPVRDGILLATRR